MRYAGLQHIVEICLRALRRVSSPIARRHFVLAPVAWDGLDAPADPAGVWLATNAEPAIHLQSSRTYMPCGWVRLSIDLRLANGDSALGWIHADTGAGFDKVAPARVPLPVNGRIEQTVRLPGVVKRLRYDPIKGRGEFTLGQIAAQEIGWPEVFFRQMLRYRQGEDLSPMMALRAAVVHVRIYGLRGLWAWIREYVNGEHPDTAYGPWTVKHDTRTIDELQALGATAKALPRRPKFSIVMPVHNTPERWLRKAIDSVLAQVYDNWELCICDDNSTDANIVALLDTYRSADPRIRVVHRAQSGNIAAATNDAMSVMTGDFMCLLDHDDVIAPDALLEFALALNEQPDIDLLYSDEDLISIDDVRYYPISKPCWSPEYLEACMYIGHFACYRADIARRIGGFRPDYHGSQDYDFTLRFTEHARNIHHIPRLLYHWRALPGSVAASIDRKDYVMDAARRALEDRLQRSGGSGTVVRGPARGWFEMRRDIVGNPLVSIVVSPAGLQGLERDRAAALLRGCLDSIQSKSTYRNFEILEGTLESAAPAARGDYLVLVGGDTEVVTAGWLESMLRLAQRPGMGAVGAKLLFSDRTLRHVGLTFCDGLPHHIRQGYPRADHGYRGSSIGHRNYLAVSGACLMLSREALGDAGGPISDQAPEYFDADLCLRLIECGRRNALAPAAVLFQRGNDPFGGSSGDPMASDTARRFRRRWDHRTTPDPYYGANLSLRPPNFEFQPPPGRQS